MPCRPRPGGGGRGASGRGSGIDRPTPIIKCIHSGWLRGRDISLPLAAIVSVVGSYARRLVGGVAIIKSLVVCFIILSLSADLGRKSTRETGRYFRGEARGL